MTTRVWEEAKYLELKISRGNSKEDHNHTQESVLQMEKLADSPLPDPEI